MFDRSKALVIAACLALAAQRLPAQQPLPLDPAAWGSDRAGRPVPEFTSGDECLFCHRTDVGNTWPGNRHGRTVRNSEPMDKALVALGKRPGLKEFAPSVELLLGAGEQQVRFLKRSSEHGKLDLLTAKWTPPLFGTDGKFTAAENPQWEGKLFGDKCAGCHATAVNSSQRTFSAISLDCFACHGEVPDKHTTLGALVVLSPHRQNTPREITSICAQCHARTGTSRSTGLPFANNFVAGDNLFRDFQVDLSAAAIENLNPADRHVQENIRDVVLLGREEVTCLTCHDVHKQSSRKHHLAADSVACANCHPRGLKGPRLSYEVHSTTCGY